LSARSFVCITTAVVVAGCSSSGRVDLSSKLSSDAGSFSLSG
jgi:hypothetical protein